MALSDVSNFWGFEIEEQINAVPGPNYTSFITAISSELENTIPDFPFIARLGNDVGEFELITVTNKVIDTWEITRGEQDTVALEHPIGTKLEIVFTKGHWDEIKAELIEKDNKINMLTAALFYAVGQGNKFVFQNPAFDFLEVVPSGSGLDINVKYGYAYLLETIYTLSADSEFNTIVAPVSGSRKDVVILTPSGIEIKTGDGASGFLDVTFTYPIPSNVNAIALAEIDIDVGDSGYPPATITDVRPFI